MRLQSNFTLTRYSEVVLAIAVAIIQILFYAFVLGTLFHYLVRQDENSAQFKALMKAVDNFVQEHALPPPLADKIVEHYRFLHRKQSATTDRIFAQMPHRLQSEVQSVQYSGEMRATWMFASCSESFLAAVVLPLRERFMTPRQTLFKRGDGGLELHWCVDGVLHVKKDDTVISTIRADIGPGQVVGEIAFFLGIPQPHSVQASSAGEVTLIVLTASSFEDVASSYPEEVKGITQTILQRYNLDKHGEDIGAPLVDDSRNRDEVEVRNIGSLSPRSARTPLGKRYTPAVLASCSARTSCPVMPCPPPPVVLAHFPLPPPPPPPPPHRSRPRGRAFAGDGGFARKHSQGDHRP